jgi:hypothetical protein
MEKHKTPSQNGKKRERKIFKASKIPMPSKQSKKVFVLEDEKEDTSSGGSNVPVAGSSSASGSSSSTSSDYKP